MGYIVLSNLPQWRTVDSLIRNGSGIVSLKIFNGYVDENKKFPQYDYVNLRCGRVHFNISLNKKGISYKLQLSLLNQEKNHDEIYEDTWAGGG